MLELTHPYESLTPDLILAAVESRGFNCDGHLQALNSYENRVYQVGIDDGQPLIAKFYRPHRWSRGALLEEHQFVAELAAAELPVVAPLTGPATHSLHEFGSFFFALFERRGGRAPEFDRHDALSTMGRFLARMHTVGARQPFAARGAIDVETFGVQAVNAVRDDFIPADLSEAYGAITTQLLARLEARFKQCGRITLLRVHGDCHGGNVLWRDDAPHFVDFDDARMAPAVQDLWMLLSGQPEDQQAQLATIIEAYESFRDFDYRELSLIEPLRTLRIMHFAAWLARRWSDPAFPRAFPWFNTQAYWEKHIVELKEQLAALDEPLMPSSLQTH
ncbi:MAG: serine/threonine protein kinase [Gammaproteobacteria bacterium]